MSYDFYLEVDSGGPEPATVADVGNMTSNVSGIWHEAMGIPMADLDGKEAWAIVDYFERGVRALRYEPEKFQHLEPKNGWGSAESAKDMLWALVVACTAHPKATLRISR